MMQAPIKTALGEDWERLHPVIQRHCDLPPDAEKTCQAIGRMDVTISGLGRVFVMVSRLFDALVPYAAKQITILVKNSFSKTGDVMYWHRTFNYPDHRPVVFQSRMVHESNNVIVEYVRFGLGIRMALSIEEDALRYDSRGYLWDLRIVRLYIPDWLLMGKAIIREIPIDDEGFKVEFEIDHPWWGRTFGYRGQFKLAASG